MKLKNFNVEFGSKVFRSFSDISRIRIMNILFNRKEACISDLELILNFTQTKTSRHVNYLKNAGLLNKKNINQFIFYSIKEEALDLIDQIFKLLEKDKKLEEDIEIYDIMNANRELSKNKLEINYK